MSCFLCLRLFTYSKSQDYNISEAGRGSAEYYDAEGRCILHLKQQESILEKDISQSSLQRASKAETPSSEAPEVQSLPDGQQASDSEDHECAEQISTAPVLGAGVFGDLDECAEHLCTSALTNAVRDSNYFAIEETGDGLPDSTRGWRRESGGEDISVFWA